MLRRATHEDRLLMAGQIRDELKKSLGDDLRAFVIFASTAKEEDGPYSDLEMMAIMTDDYDETACGFMREGIYCEIYYIPFMKALKDAAKIDQDWPFSADQWHRMLPVYVKQGDDCVGHIQMAAWQSLNKEEEFRKAAGLSVFPIQEEIGSLMNAWEKGVRSDVCTHLFNFSVMVVKLMSFMNRHFYPSMRNAWEESKKLENLPKDYAELIEIIHGETSAPVEVRYVTAFGLWQNILDWMDELGIKWEKEGVYKMPKKIFRR
ncbi:hypothetical protein GX441_09550 [bacterium]|nr:hypothetical protein [bacterium]